MQQAHAARAQIPRREAGDVSKLSGVDVESLGEVVGTVFRRIRMRCEESGCASRAKYLCDWKIGHNRGLCDRLCCAQHVGKPSKGKHLCCEHEAEWQKRRAAMARPVVA